nr:hypothetical protein [Candidatus Palauibacterales bacterium]
DRGGRAEHPSRGTGGGRDAARSLASRFREARDLALQGRQEEAAARFEAVAGRAGPTGLLAEAVDPESGRLRGNVPSAAAHAALVDAARVLAGAGSDAPAARGSQKGQKDQ